MKRFFLQLLTVLFLFSACSGAGAEDTVPSTAASAPPAETQPTSPYPQPMALVGVWERIWTEVEGDRTETLPGEVFLTILGTSEQDLSVSYWSRSFPENNYDSKALILDRRPLYAACSNPEWSGDVDYLGPFDTSYALTIQADGTLLLQNYFLIDGSPAVGYECFRLLDG